MTTATPEFKPPPTPFAGWVKSARGILVPAASGPHIIASAPPGTGKTRRWLAVSAAMWQSSALVSSSRDDLMLLVSRRRPGPAQLLDLRPIQSPPYPGDIKHVKFDPTACITTFQQAQRCARAMLRLSGAGTPGGIRVEANGMWDDLALAPLTCILWAASSDSTFRMSWALQAAENPDAPDPDPKTGIRDWSSVNPAKPGWAAAASDMYCNVRGAREFQARVRGVLAQEPRQRDSVKMTISHALTGWLVSGLDGTPTEDFDLSFLDKPDHTLYVLCPMFGDAAPVASLLMEMLIDRRRELVHQHDTLSHLALFLDELTNTPLANLDGNIAENRGLGVSICGAMQDSTQLEVVYGTQRAHAIMNVVPASLMMYGAHEERWLRSATYWIGKTTSSTHTYSNNSDERTTGREWRDMFDPSELNPVDENHARLLIRGTAGQNVYLPDFVESMAHFDEAVRIARAEQMRRQHLSRRTG
ncbi:type IV secretory system conjugative DNA transfer family protein [Mycolicibacterium mageritense]|uniref:type IV secretory system conjugative DNA transfer family protein n=1 Tax=Mycolicibacterium mageritense TaxID=53462 RepID=UPI0011D93EBC|nr:TraM recognition domain-containing protein [Mycolicibacterium mageritense]TXI56444.1 MAG: type IV secretory system conjugative DNA transfer family protein [Mycolicibacterium mageritense]